MWTNVTINNLLNFYHPVRMNSQFGMLMPAGIPLLPNERTSSDVKSGRRKASFSYAAGQGNSGRKCSACSTSLPNFALISLLTIATNPILFNTKCSRYRTKTMVFKMIFCCKCKTYLTCPHTFEFTSNTERISVRFNESDVPN